MTRERPVSSVSRPRLNLKLGTVSLVVRRRRRGARPVPEDRDVEHRVDLEAMAVDDTRPHRARTARHELLRRAMTPR